MSMSNFIVRDAIIPALTATTREDAIRELVQSLSQSDYFQNTEVEEIVSAILQREKLGSTGIGKNIAIPHSRYAGVHRLIGTLGLSQGGIPFDSIDGEPVHIIILLVSPQDQPAAHLRALEMVVRTMKVDGFVERLRTASSKDEIWQLLDASQAW